jgi:hypothetical protein
MLLLLRSLLDKRAAVLPPEVAAASGPGSKRSARSESDLLIEQVLDKWDAIEAVRQVPDQEYRELEAPAPVLVDQEEDAPAELEPQSFQVAGLDFPFSLVTRAPTLAPAPLLPSTEYLIRDAIERDDEEALILILAQL